MLKNYVATALNNLLKNRLFSLINIGGLAIGLAACTLIAQYVQDETSYDRHWQNGDRLYRINTTLDRSGDAPRTMSANSLLLLPALREFFPEEIEASTRMLRNGRDLRIDSAVYRETVVAVEQDFVSMFQLDVLAGDLDASLRDESSIALESALAEKFFGRGDAIGRIVTMGNDDSARDLRVGAVYRLPEGNTVMELPALVQLNAETMFGGWMGPFASRDFILLRAGTDAAAIAARLAAFTDRNVDISMLEAGPGVLPSERVSFDLQNIADIYLGSPFEGNGDRGDSTMVLAFSAIAILVLLIGCINFTVLSTAKATQRAREVAVRKVVGASKGQLMRQFLGESFLIVLPALLLSMVLVEMLLPFFESIVGNELEIRYASPATWLTQLALLLMVSFAGGLYPALVLSHFRPAVTLKANQSAEGGGSGALRNVLVVFQFSVAIALMIATAVIYAQVTYAMKRDPGFDRENLLLVENLREADASEKNTLKQLVGNSAAVVGASLSGHRPMQVSGSAIVDMAFSRAGTAAESFQFKTLGVDADFFEVYRVPLLAGRDFDEVRDQPSVLFQPEFSGASSRGNVIVNASTARTLGFVNVEDAIGAVISSQGFNEARHDLSIIGVVADTQFASLRILPVPEVYVLAPAQPGYMRDVLTVRFQGEVQAVLADLREAWKAVMGDSDMVTSLVAQNMAAEFEQESTEARMLISFALLAITIACLGLFGSATYNIERRTREIGIRKVMGAEVREIVSLLLWQFSKPVMLANLIAWPLAIWLMLRWLTQFPYQISAWWLLPLCVVAGMLALAITAFTVAGNTWRVAVRSPLHSLRYE